MSLSISLVTRGRPALLRKTLERTIAGIRMPDTRIVVAVDADDWATVAVADELRAMPHVLVDVREREDYFGDKWNRVLGVAPADLYGMLTDYGPYTSAGWDEKLHEAAAAFPDGIGVVYDWLANLSFPCTMTVTRRMTELMGNRIFPAVFPYWFVDHWLTDIAQMIGRVSFADVTFDRSARPGTQDQREPGFWGEVYNGLYMERMQTAASIIQSDEFQEPAWRKALLLRNFPLIEQRSRMLNGMLTNMEGTEKNFDERYLRIRAAAVAKLEKVA